MFELSAPYQPAGDQPQAIAKLTEGRAGGREAPDAAGRDRLGQDVHRGQRHPGTCNSRRWSSRITRRSPRSFTPSSRASFPDNAVEYFVSYFDYYQPEAYIPRTDTFIEKDSSINEEIERLRLSTMSSLF